MMSHRVSGRIGNSPRPQTQQPLACSRSGIHALRPRGSALRASVVALPGFLGTAPQTDADVPEGHASLHTTLYGSGGAEEHDSDAKLYRIRQEEDDGSTVVPIQQWLEAREGEKPLGVYAVYGEDSTVQYVGYSRNMVTAVRGHAARVPAARASAVRAMVFANKSMSSREHLEREVSSWVERHAGGVMPAGNTTDRDLWEGNGSKVYSEAEMTAYSEKAAKLKKAMAVGVGKGAAAEVEPELTPEQRRDNWRKAVEGDNWSTVIESQTQEATGVATPTRVSANAGASGTAAPAGVIGAAGGAATSSSGPVISPFTQPTVHRSIGNNAAGGGGGGGSNGNGGGAAPSSEAFREMTVANADAVLNEVRPYLVADGGDVEVMNVEHGIIFLRLQGACSTCASSAATMKMGIERALKAAFGDALKEVIQVGKVDVVTASAANINSHLDSLRGAISSFGGRVEVAEVEGSKATVRYKGPPAIGKGVSAAIRDRFPEIREVVLIDFTE